MADTLTVLVLIFSVSFVCTYAYVLSDDDHEIVWPTEYHFSGEKINFQTTLKTPFEVWSSEPLNRARIDYYGGTNKLFFNGEENITYTVFPMTDSDLDVEETCWMTGDSKGEMELPDVSTLSFTGQTVSLFDKLVDVWTGQSDGDVYVVDETLYVYKTEQGVAIPVQHIVKILNEALGEVRSHTITNYYNFKNSISDEDLLNQPEDCTTVSDFKKAIQLLHPDIPEHLEHAFNSYADHHGRDYRKKETQMRKQIFENNWRKVREHNSKNLGYRLEVNEFSDRTPEELKYLNCLLPPKEPSKLASPFPHTLEEINDIADQLPESFDLRIEGAVTPIKNQGHCGSCWAFATTAALEGAFARSNGGRLLDLSEQSVVDCAWSEGNLGCDGGMLDYAWNYFLKSGIATERDYGVYMEHDGFCHINNMTTLYTIKGFAHVTPRNPEALKVALYKYGPVTIGVKATDKMLSYANGLFYDFECDPETSHPNHAVTVVGYGTRDGEDYWIVKNSWGEAWGEDGYILMSARNNNCLVLDYPSYPVV